MGKRYYCDYCDKSMVSTPGIVKTHNKGLFHQKLVQEHYQQYKDPETILSEECNKKPCSRFAQGNCNFGAICRFSHYTPEQLNGFKEYVAFKHRSKFDILQPSFEELYQMLQNEKSMKPQDVNNTILCDSNGNTHVLPWNYNNILDTYSENLPPSIKRFKMEDFKDFEITEWGW